MNKDKVVVVSDGGKVDALRRVLFIGFIIVDTIAGCLCGSDVAVKAFFGGGGWCKSGVKVKVFSVPVISVDG